MVYQLHSIMRRHKTEKKRTITNLITLVKKLRPPTHNPKSHGVYTRTKKNQILTSQNYKNLLLTPTPFHNFHHVQLQNVTMHAQQISNRRHRSSTITMDHFFHIRPGTGTHVQHKTMRVRYRFTFHPMHNFFTVHLRAAVQHPNRCLLHQFQLRRVVEHFEIFRRGCSARQLHQTQICFLFERRPVQHVGHAGTAPHSQLLDFDVAVVVLVDRGLHGGEITRLLQRGVFFGVQQFQHERSSRPQHANVHVFSTGGMKFMFALKFRHQTIAHHFLHRGRTDPLPVAKPWGLRQSSQVF